MQSTLMGRAARGILFGAEALAAAVSPSTYTAPVRAIAARQVCASAWQVLPAFVLSCAVLGALAIRIVAAAAQDFGLSAYVLDLYVRGMVLEIVPLFVALFVALRSGSALGTEVALMRVGGALEPDRVAGTDPLHAELLPRGIGVAAAVLALTVIGCVVTLAVAYVGLFGFSPWGHDAYARAIGQVFAPAVMAGFAIKVAAFSLAVAIVPVAASLNGSRDLRTVPGAAPRGLVSVFMILALVEAASLAFKYT